MAYCEKNDPPVWTDEIIKWDKETLGDGDAMGAVIEQLFNNTVYNNELLDTLKNTAENELDRMQAYKNIILPASGWSASAPYQQTVTVEGISESDTPVIAVDIPEGTTAEQEKAIKKAASYISYADTGDGTITVTCIAKKPETDMQLSIKGV